MSGRDLIEMADMERKRLREEPTDAEVLMLDAIRGEPMNGVLISVPTFERFQRLGRLEDAHRQLAEAARDALFTMDHNFGKGNSSSADALRAALAAVDAVEKP